MTPVRGPASVITVWRDWEGGTSRMVQCEYSQTNMSFLKITAVDK